MTACLPHAARRGALNRRGVRIRLTALAALATSALTFAGASLAQPAAGPAGASVQRTLAPEPWRFSLTPYVWLPTINAHIDVPLPPIGGGGGGTAPDGSLETEIGPNRYLSNLNFALMLAGEARRGPWSVLLDYIGLDVSGEGGRAHGVSVGGNLLPGIDLAARSDTRTALRASVVNLLGGYTVLSSERYRMDAVAGVRAGWFGADIDWRLGASVTLPDGTPLVERTGSVSVSLNPVDAVVGVRGRWQIDERWSIPYHLDIGTGTSQFTWQGFVGASYAFGWGEMLLAWRHLSLRDERRDVFRHVSLSGPTIGATFRF
jgi:hypothetical protein